jgi:hypothetical protein
MDDSSTLGDYCRLHFRVKCQTKQGQKVALKINEGPIVHLVTSPSAYPVWFNSKPFVLPRSTCKTTSSSSTAVSANVDSIKYRYGLVDGATFKCFETVHLDPLDASFSEFVSTNCRGVVLDALDTVVEDCIEDCEAAFPLAFVNEMSADKAGSGVLDMAAHMMHPTDGSASPSPHHSPKKADAGLAPEGIDGSRSSDGYASNVPFSSDFKSASSDRSGLIDSTDSVPVKSLSASILLKDLINSADSAEGAYTDIAGIQHLPTPLLSDVSLPTDGSSPGALGSEEQPSNLFIVCYHLPVKVTRLRNLAENEENDDNGPLFEISWAESLISQSNDEHSVAKAMHTKWIGTISGVKNISEVERGLLTDQLAS